MPGGMREMYTMPGVFFFFLVFSPDPDLFFGLSSSSPSAYSGGSFGVTVEGPASVEAASSVVGRARFSLTAFGMVSC